MNLPPSHGSVTPGVLPTAGTLVIGISFVILSGLAMHWMAAQPAAWPYWVLPWAIGAAAGLVAAGRSSLLGVVAGIGLGWALEFPLELNGIQTHLNVSGRLAELVAFWPILVALIAYDPVAVAAGFALVQVRRGRRGPDRPHPR